MQNQPIYCWECRTTHPVEGYQNGKPIIYCEKQIKTSHTVGEMAENTASRKTIFNKSSDKRYVVFRSRPGGLTSPRREDLVPLISSLSPSVRLKPMVVTNDFSSKVKNIQETPCTLEDNRCFGINCWSFQGNVDDRGHTIRQLYYQ